MTDIVKTIREEISRLNHKYMTEVQDYDFYNEHIRLVVNNAMVLADKYDADKEIVELGALLHDIALLRRTIDDDYVVVKGDHHKIGAEIAVDMLERLNYPEEKIERVRKCVYNHRSSKNSTTIEETCVADADILAHFDNLPMLFQVALVLKGMSLSETRNEVKQWLAGDYDDLSERTKIAFKDKYENIVKILFN